MSINHNQNPRSSPKQSLANQLLFGGIGSLMVQGAEVGLSLGVVVLLARLLGAEGYGTYAFVFALVSIGALVAQAGLPTLVVRETARGQKLNDWPMVLGVWDWANRLALSVSLVVMVGVGVSIWLGWLVEGVMRKTMAWGLWLIPLIALLSISSASLRGLRLNVLGMIPDQLVRPGLFAATLLVVWLIPRASLSPDNAMALGLVAAAAAFLTATVLLRRYRPTDVILAKPQYRRRAWLSAAWPMALTQGFQHINRHADVMLLGLLASVAHVGAYRVAAQGAVLVALGLTALNLIIAPYATRLYTEHATRKLEKVARRAAQAAIAFGLPATVLFALTGEWLLTNLFGEEFHIAYWPLLILAGGQLINAWFGPTALLLTMTGYEREVTLAVAAAALVNVVLNILLIPQFASIGAAIATSTSLAFWNVWLSQVVKKRLGIRCSVI